MDSNELQLNYKAIAEANAVAAPFNRATDDAHAAFRRAEAKAEDVWREAYDNAMKAKE
jgi:hypothetical protein